MPTLRLRWRLLYAVPHGWGERGVIRSNAEIDADRLTNLCNCRAPQALPFLLNHPAAGRSLLCRQALHRHQLQNYIFKKTTATVAIDGYCGGFFIPHTAPFYGRIIGQKPLPGSGPIASPCTGHCQLQRTNPWLHGIRRSSCLRLPSLQ